MYVKTNLVYSYLMAKTIAKIYAEPDVAGRDLKYVHRIYGKPVCGVSYDTFRKHVRIPEAELGGIEFPPFVVATIQMLGFFRDCELHGIPLPKSGKLKPEELDDYLEKTILRRREMRKKQEERKRKKPKDK